MSKLNAIKTTTIKGLKGAGLKVKDGTLYVTDSIEYGVEKVNDKIGGVILEHRTNHADRMLARMVARDERKAEDFGAKAEAWHEEEMDLKASGKCTIAKKNIFGQSIHCGKDVVDGEDFCQKHVDERDENINEVHERMEATGK